MAKKKIVRTGRNAKRGSFPREKAVLVPLHPDEKAQLDYVAKSLSLSRPASIRLLIAGEFTRRTLGATVPEQSVISPA